MSDYTTISLRKEFVADVEEYIGATVGLRTDKS